MDDELEQVNQQHVEEYIPAIVLVIIVLIIGLTGNTLAVIYYGWKAQKCVAQYLIFWLSVNDAVTNIVLVDDVVDFFNTVKYQNIAACKIFWVFKHWLIANSLLFMVSIAVERYRHVCFPFAKQCTLRAARLMIAGLGTFSLLISVRYFATGDVIRINITTNINSTKGFYCSLSVAPEMHSVEEVFHYIDICVHVAIICCLVVLYTQIIRKVIQSHRTIKSHEQQSFISYTRKRIHRQDTVDSTCSSSVVEIHLDKSKNARRLNRQDTPETTCSTDDLDIQLETPRKGRKLDHQDTIDSSISGDEIDMQHDSPRAKRALSHQDTADSTGDVEIHRTFSQSSTNAKDSTKHQTSNGKSKIDTDNLSACSSSSKSTRRHQISQALKRMTLKPSLSVTAKTEMRITLMVTVITIVSMACFIPYYLAMLLVEGNLSGDGLILTLGQVIWRRSFMLNSAINPFIMAFFNGQFRSFIVETLKCKRFREK